MIEAYPGLPLGMSKRRAAQILGKPTYTGQKCGTDGTATKYTDTGKCVECAHYVQAIRSGKIEGVDQRTAAQKAGEITRSVKSGWRDEGGWTDEMRRLHSEAIKRGRRRKKMSRMLQDTGVRA